ncbi:MAG TPA: hypothetical protein DCF33_04350 [Saprospirales bacterium]|nr:hypothetical protein [Saprospirales bacterium]
MASNVILFKEYNNRNSGTKVETFLDVATNKICRLATTKGKEGGIGGGIGFIGVYRGFRGL